MRNKSRPARWLAFFVLLAGSLVGGCSAGSPHPDEAQAKEAIAKQMPPDEVILKDLSVSWGDAKENGERKIAPFKARFEIAKDLYAQDTDYYDKELRRRGLPTNLNMIRGWNADGKQRRAAFFTLLNAKGTSFTAYGKVAYQRQADRWKVEAGEIEVGEAKTIRTGFMGMDGVSFGYELPAKAQGFMGEEVPAYRVDSPEAKAYFDAIEQKVKELER